MSINLNNSNSEIIIFKNSNNNSLALVKKATPPILSIEKIF